MHHSYKLNSLTHLSPFCNCTETETWEPLECIGEAEAGRAGHVSIIFDDRLFIFGGGDGKNWLNDIYECDIRAPKWSLIEHTTDSSGHIAPGCYGLSAVVYENEMFIFGGGDGKEWYNNIYTYKLGDHQRKRLTMDKLYRQLTRRVFCDVEVAFAADMPWVPETAATAASSEEDLEEEMSKKVKSCAQEMISMLQEPVLSGHGSIVVMKDSTSTIGSSSENDVDALASSGVIVPPSSPVASFGGVGAAGGIVSYGAYEEYLAMKEEPHFNPHQID